MRDFERQITVALRNEALPMAVALVAANMPSVTPEARAAWAYIVFACPENGDKTLSGVARAFPASTDRPNQAFNAVAGLARSIVFGDHYTAMRFAGRIRQYAPDASRDALARCIVPAAIDRPNGETLTNLGYLLREKR